MAKELADYGIRVVAVAPGDIRTKHSAKSMDKVGKRRDAADRTNSALCGPGSPKDVAATVVFVCSEKAKFVNGVTWVVDGGALA
jgi:3-oxoacyl-[acyl-carrier protein] reductase